MNLSARSPQTLTAPIRRKHRGCGSASVFERLAPPVTFFVTPEERRRSIMAPDESPGPGSYNVPTDTMFNVRNAHKIQHRKCVSYHTDTGNINFLAPQSVIDSHTRSISIGARDNLVYSNELPNDSPGPGEYVPKSTLSGGHVISSSRSDLEKPSDTPGPGYYSVDHRAHIISSHSSSAISSVPHQDPWAETVGDSNLGPGTYNPVEMPARPKRWATRLRGTVPIMKVTQLKRNQK